MASIEKLIEKFVYHPGKINSINDVRRVLDYFGYNERSKRGSECLFHKKGASAINVPTIGGRSVKSVYVKIIVRTLNLEEWIELQKGKQRTKNSKRRPQDH